MHINGLETMKIRDRDWYNKENSFTFKHEGYDNLSVQMEMKSEYLGDVLQQFSAFLNACGFSYVSKIAAVYDDGSGLDSEGHGFFEDENFYEDEMEDVEDEDEGDYEQE